MKNIPHSSVGFRISLVVVFATLIALPVLVLITLWPGLVIAVGHVRDHVLVALCLIVFLLVVREISR